MKRILFLLLILTSFTTINSALGHPETIDTFPQKLGSELKEDFKTLMEQYFIITLIVVIVVIMTITVSVIYREELVKQVTR